MADALVAGPLELPGREPRRQVGATELPGAGDGVTAGQAEFIEPLASAGVAAGVDGVFMEVHEEPSRARSDAQNALRLDLLEPLLERLVKIHSIERSDSVRLKPDATNDSVRLKPDTTNDSVRLKPDTTSDPTGVASGFSRTNKKS